MYCVIRKKKKVLNTHELSESSDSHPSVVFPYVAPCQPSLLAEMATGRNPSSSVVPYPHPPTLTLPAKKLIPACRFRFLPIPESVWFFYPSGNPYPIAYPS
jgi:hypothetical protein